MMMSFRRIQKLLYSPEYGELEDIVVLESPFAQITPEGKGIRQVQIALTPTKLILAQDIFGENTIAENSNDDKKINLETVTVSSDVDAEIESLELVSIIPINLVTLSLFVQGRKRALKARLRNGQVYYFELGGSCHRKMLWKLWSDKVKSMSPGAPISSSSENATTNSSSHASACIKKKFSRTTSSHECGPSKHNDKCPKDIKILRSCKTKLPSKRKPWTDRNLFPTEIDDDDGKGESFATYKPSKAEELSKNLQFHDQCKGDSAEKSDDKLSWSVSKHVELNLINERQMMSVMPRRKKMATSGNKISQRSILVNRFDSGVSENCELGLYLAPLDRANDDQFKEQSTADYINPTDAGVRMWEKCSDAKGKRKSYSSYSCDFVAFPHFYNGLGPAGNHISLEEKRLLQLRRTKSVFQLNKLDSDEMCLPIPKHHLTATISYDNLTLPLIEEGEHKKYEKLLRKFPCSPLHWTGTRFWMPDLSCQSSSANDIYHKQREILENLHGRRICSQGRSKEISTISAMSSKPVYGHNSAISKLSSEGDKARRRCNTVYEKEIKRKICISGEENLRCENCCCKLTGQNQDMNNLTTFQSMLKFHIKIFARDFTSTTLAYQLTMIDRDLFLQIPVSELGLIIYQKYHLKEKNFLYPLASLHNGTPCISALISFSHRISCLVSSAVLEEESIKERARSVVHFINIAHKCFQLQNFQSCRSILLGLQSPAIFRLRETWKHVKRKNYNKYQTFRHLCRFYINVQMTGYSGITKNSRRIPFLPCISFILNYLQETKLKIEIVNESYIANSSKGSEHKIEMDIQNAIGDDAKRYKKEPDFLNNEDAERNVPKAHCYKFISFLSTVFRSNRKQKNSKRRYSGTVDTLWERSPTVTVDKHSKGKINDYFSFAGINDNSLKLYLSSVGKDRQSSDIIDQEKYSYFHREVEYSRECVLENLLEIFKKTSETLISSQYCAYNYALPQSDLAKEYILKAKYKEHLQNYKLSLRVENL